MMDKYIRMVKIKVSTEKAEADAMVLNRPIPNLGGPTASKKNIISTVV